MERERRERRGEREKEREGIIRYWFYYKYESYIFLIVFWLDIGVEE